MESRNQLRAMIVEDLPTELRDRLLRSQQRLGREGTERYDHLRLDRFDLAEEEWLAAVDLVGFRVAVLGRTALHHVRDVDVIAREAHGFDHLGEQLPGPPDKGNALDVLVRPRRLADEHQVRVHVPDAKDDLLAPERRELAAY